MMKKTAECVTPNHPDKICDRISDAILDACLEQDPYSRVAVETMGGHGIISITGEITTRAVFDARKIAKNIVGDKYGVQVNIVSQSPEIAQGVDNGGAGDQGIMVGYACDDNEAMIPHELFLARSLAKFLYEKYPFDGKTQITLNGKNEIEVVVASFQNVESAELNNAVVDWLTGVVGVKHEDVEKVVIHANPAGDWNIGGFEADTGVTGRKLAVDNYGPQVPIGGGAFSGKDASKVDRSAAYMARKIAVDYLKKYKARVVEVRLAYAIGVKEPVMATALIVGGTEGQIVSKSVEGYDLSPKGIIDRLGLKRSIFEKTAQWGHFGNGFDWDKENI